MSLLPIGVYAISSSHGSTDLAEVIANNDKLVVLVNSEPFDGDINDAIAVNELLADPMSGPPLTIEGYDEYEKIRQTAIAALRHAKAAGSRPGSAGSHQRSRQPTHGGDDGTSRTPYDPVDAATLEGRPSLSGIRAPGDQGDDDGLDRTEPLSRLPAPSQPQLQAGTRDAKATSADAATSDSSNPAGHRRSGTNDVPLPRQAPAATTGSAGGVAANRAAAGSARPAAQQQTAPAFSGFGGNIATVALAALAQSQISGADQQSPPDAGGGANTVRRSSVSNGPGTPGGPPAAQRRLSLTGNQKLRRAVHKLVLINRFNKAANTLEGKSMKSMTNGGGSASGNSSNTLGGSNHKGSRSGFKSRWGRRSIVGKTIDQYIKETSNIYNYTDQRALVDTDEKVPWYLIVPEVNWRVTWDILILSLVIYFSLTVPVKIGFNLETSYSDMVFDYLSDCIFIVDIVINFFTTYKEDGVWVTDRRRVAEGYATSWFPVDLLSSFPIGWFVDNIGDGGQGAGGINKLLRMLRMAKLFRLLRLLKLFPKVFAILETSVKIDPALLRFMRSFVFLLMTWHLMGCAYWFMVLSEYNGIESCPGNTSMSCFVNQCLCDPNNPTDPSAITVLNDTQVGWYDPNWPDEWVPQPSFANAGLLRQYMFAVYWAVAATTSIGENIVPRSANETAFTMVMIFFGLMMYSMIIGAASSALANLDTTASARRQMLDNVLGFMRARKVPRFFQKIIVDYYKHRWNEPAQTTDDILADLPASLRSRLTMIMNRDLVERFPILQHMTADVYLRLVQRLQYGTYLPGEFIARQGEMGDHLFLLKRGKVDAVLPNGVTVFATFMPGEFFGEHSVLFLTKRDASYRAVDFVDLLILSRADFTELYISAPEFIREIQRVDLIREKARLDRELSVIKKPKSGGGAMSGGSASKLVVRRIGDDSSTGGGKAGGAKDASGSSTPLSLADIEHEEEEKHSAHWWNAAWAKAMKGMQAAVATVAGGHNQRGAAVAVHSHGSEIKDAPAHGILRKDRPKQQKQNSSGKVKSTRSLSFGRSRSQSPPPTAAAAAGVGSAASSTAAAAGTGIGGAAGGAAASQRTTPRLKPNPGADGYEPEVDFDLFGDGNKDDDGGGGKPASLVKRISASVRSLLPTRGSAKRQHLRQQPATINEDDGTQVGANPYRWKNSGEDDDDDDGDVRQVVAEDEPHIPNLATPEPQGRIVRGPERRASLRRPPTAELLKLQAPPTRSEIDMLGTGRTTARPNGPPPVRIDVLTDSGDGSAATSPTDSVRRSMLNDAPGQVAVVADGQQQARGDGGHHSTTGAGGVGGGDGRQPLAHDDKVRTFVGIDSRESSGHNLDNNSAVQQQLAQQHQTGVAVPTIRTTPVLPPVQGPGTSRRPSGADSHVTSPAHRDVDRDRRSSAGISAASRPAAHGTSNVSSAGRSPASVSGPRRSSASALDMDDNALDALLEQVGAMPGQPDSPSITQHANAGRRGSQLR